MKPHKISIKRKKSFKLTHQKNKFVLFIGEDGQLDYDLPLHSHMAAFIKKFISKKAFKNIALNKSIALDNPITLEPDRILIIRIKNLLNLYQKKLLKLCKIFQSLNIHNYEVWYRWTSKCR